MTRARIDQYMTRSLHSIGQDQTLAAAHRLMRRYRIRHLPVLAGGRLVGIVSQRDLHFIETLGGVDPEAVAVSEAMTADPYTVPPGASLERVAATMAKRKYGAVIIEQRGRPIGVFTTVDALRALSQLAGRAGAAPARSTIDPQHEGAQP
jgi:acetoin utilization protein AcuB